MGKLYSFLSMLFVVIYAKIVNKQQYNICYILNYYRFKFSTAFISSAKYINNIITSASNMSCLLETLGLCELSIELQIDICHQLNSSTVGNQLFYTDSDKHNVLLQIKKQEKSLNLYCSSPYKKLSFKRLDSFNICFYFQEILFVISKYVCTLFLFQLIYNRDSVKS